jgi:hypothetical protein
MRAPSLSIFLCFTSVMSLGSIAQQAKPNNHHVDVATLQVKVTLNGGVFQGNQLVVYADPTNDMNGSQLVLATQDSAGWVFKQLPLGNYGVSAWAPGLAGYAENVLNGWVTVTATTAPVQIAMKPQQSGSLWVHVVTSLGKPVSGVKVEFKAQNSNNTGREKVSQCVTLGDGLCYPYTGFLLPGTWSVSIPGQSPRQVTLVKEGPPLTVEFKQATDIKEIHNTKPVDLK